MFDDGMKRVWVGPVTFKREKHSDPERGIAIGNNPDDIWRIVDRMFKPVNKTPWSFHTHPFDGCFWTEI